MKVIICGSRDFDTDDLDVMRVLDMLRIKFGGITEILSGNARGADQLGLAWASSVGIPFNVFVPNWNEYGKSAGMIRNQEMVDNADALIAIWDGSSKGTKRCIEMAEKKGIPVEIIKVRHG